MFVLVVISPECPGSRFSLTPTYPMNGRRSFIFVRIYHKAASVMPQNSVCIPQAGTRLGSCGVDLHALMVGDVTEHYIWREGCGWTYARESKTLMEEVFAKLRILRERTHPS